MTDENKTELTEEEIIDVLVTMETSINDYQEMLELSRAMKRTGNADSSIADDAFEGEYIPPEELKERLDIKKSAYLKLGKEVGIFEEENPDLEDIERV